MLMMELTSASAFIVDVSEDTHLGFGIPNSKIPEKQIAFRGFFIYSLLHLPTQLPP
jgi:hypothetical protein